jgi:hypothetical protein
LFDEPEPEIPTENSDILRITEFLKRALGYRSGAI